ncbi:MAG: alpha/beta hydrolase [Acidimicrobiia bacterium]|nr:alpha/beta hydrolase [Acidimicrobiia bacterium]
MSRVPPAARLAIGAAAAVGAGLALEKTFVRRLRRRADPVTDPLLEVPGDVRHRGVATPDGGRLHVIERGEGRPLVLLHGITLAASIWAPQLHQLAGSAAAPGFRVIACDLRGHGGSTAGSAGYGLTVLGDDLATVLEELDLRDAIVVGHSMGGMTLMRFCADHTDVLDERVAGVAFLATAASAPIHPLLLSRATALGARLIDRLDRGDRMPGRAGDNDLSLMMCRLAFGKRPSAAAVEQVRACVEAMDDDALGRSGVGLLDHDVRETLGDLDKPALIMVGSRDVLTPVRSARAIAELLPEAELRVLPEAGHQLMQERPDEVAAELRALERRVLDEQAGVPAASD